MVTGFYNNTPQFRFVHRRNAVLRIDADKTNEENLQNAITRARSIIEPLGWFLTDYTSFPDISSIPGHYVLYWELKTRGGETLPELRSTTLEQCCYRVEESLDYVYKKCRSEALIGPLEIRVVKFGTNGFIYFSRMVTTRIHACEPRIRRKMEELRLRVGSKVVIVKSDTVAIIPDTVAVGSDTAVIRSGIPVVERRALLFCLVSWMPDVFPFDHGIMRTRQSSRLRLIDEETEVNGASISVRGSRDESSDVEVLDAAIDVPLAVVVPKGGDSSSRCRKA
ncbi:hypothetical protein GIB67_041894 [Kingdonia uniflora]|uniref:GH3 C-terminal domain-containing protein n=1 Tax=Kingdonia uniflora TaxID=39325 RepID=A0A7J7L5V3_9MAGN|nr:hypothetical protein GIB67_041894 [Kingdonia uniflora]